MQREGRGQRDVLVRNTRDVNWGWHCRQYDFATCPCHYRSCKNATTPNAATSVRFPAVPALFGLSISRRQRNIFLSLFRCCCCRACLSEKLEPRMLCTGQLWGVGLVQKSSTHVQEAAAAAFDPLPSRCGKLRRHRCAAKTLTRTRSVCRVRAAAAGPPAR